MNVFVGSANVG